MSIFLLVRCCTRGAAETAPGPRPARKLIRFVSQPAAVRRCSPRPAVEGR
jgi:hypothetical protein